MRTLILLLTLTCCLARQAAQAQVDDTRKANLS